MKSIISLCVDQYYTSLNMQIMMIVISQKEQGMQHANC